MHAAPVAASIRALSGKVVQPCMSHLAFRQPPFANACQSSRVASDVHLGPDPNMYLSHRRSSSVDHVRPAPRLRRRLCCCPPRQHQECCLLAQPMERAVAAPGSVVRRCAGATGQRTQRAPEESTASISRRSALREVKVRRGGKQCSRLTA